MSNLFEYPSGDSSRSTGDAPGTFFCELCERSLEGATAARYRAKLKRRDEADARAQQDAVDRALREQQARFEAATEGEVDRKVAEALAAYRLSHGAQDQAKDLLIARLKTSLAEQGRLLDERKSKDKGNAGEQDLLDVLQKGARQETLTPTKSGQRGADILEPVSDKHKVVGKILWEKKTGYKSFGGDWAAKAIENRARHGASQVAIVADHLPPGVEGVGLLPEGVWTCTMDFVPTTQRFLRYLERKIAHEKAKGGTGANAQAALAAFMAGEGREALARAKRAGEAIVEKGRLIKEYGETHHNALKALVQRQDDAFADIFAALNTYQNGDAA